MSSDGLAKVTYLFGEPSVAEPEASREPSETATSRGDRSGRGAKPAIDSDGWYAEPGSTDSSASAAVPVEAPQSHRPVLSVPAASHPAAPGEVGLRETATPRFPRFIENPEVPEAEPIDRKEDKKTRRASNVSMNALARRGMSSREMEKLLEQRELEPEDIESEIARLEGVGLLDDAVLAENLVRTLQERKKLGKSAINAELRRRKVDEVAIATAMESLDSDDELERAREIAIKRAGQLSSYDRETAQRRLGGFLQRRGYSGSVVSAAIKAALDESHGSRGSSGPRFE